VRFPETLSERAERFRVTRASLAGNAGKSGCRGGKFCRNGMNCRGKWTVRGTENPHFIGFFAMARRLLIPGL
jgi:hypothetical protein